MMARTCTFCGNNFSSRQALYLHSLKHCQLKKSSECQIGGQLFRNGLRVVEFDQRFKHPCTITVAGPTKAGKSTLVCNIVKNAAEMFVPKPDKILWCSGDIAAENVLPGIKYKQGLPAITALRGQPDISKLIIIDDLMTELKGNSELVNLFTKGSHHWNCSVIYIVQDLFYDRQRTNRINSQYILLLKNPADRLTPANLARQVFPGKGAFFADAFDKATKNAHGYILMDLDQSTPDNLRVRSNILPSEATKVYTPIEN